jgi:type IV pilus assembly protein PilV
MGNAASYVAGPLGTGVTDAANCTSAGTRAQIDLCEWSTALKGSSETKGGNKAGAMISGRGCVATTAVANTYMISVVWQGMNSTATPASTCGQGLYDSEASRRVVTMTVQIPDLSGS